MFGLFKRGIEHYERDLTDLSPKKREKAARNLGKAKDGRAVGLLAGALQDLTPEVRTAAALALAQLGDTSAVTSLARALEDQDPEVRTAAALALAQLGDTSAAESLVRALEDQDDNVRRAAGDSLVLLGDLRGLEARLKLLNDPAVEDPGEDVALEILQTEDGIELLIETLREHPDTELRRLAVLVLACADGSDAPVIEALAQAQAEDSSNEVRVAAGEALDLLKGLEHKEAFCLKCGSNRNIRNPQKVTLMNGAPSTMGTCPSCGKRVFRLGKG